MTDPSILTLAKAAIIPAYGFNKRTVLFASALLAAEEENQRLRRALDALANPFEHRLFNYVDVTLFARKALTPDLGSLNAGVPCSIPGRALLA
jgi:hypothetical protein